MGEARDTSTALLQLAIDRGLIDQAQADEIRREAEADDREPSTILVARGLISSQSLTDLQAEVDRALDHRAIGGHRVIGTLGRGGMGVVYRAMQQSVERVVALKVMDARMSGQGELAERFLREARTAAKINHPNVVSVFDAGRDGDILYLAMELVHGGDASDLMTASGGTLPPRRAVEIVRDAALGLGAIAEAGLIHRDIKPANIFLTDQGRAKLADLGLSRPTSGDDRMTVEGELLGTPAYMSPEQAAGRELEIRSDVYALGATLFTLCTGRVPYAGGTPMATAALVITEPFPDPQAIQPTMPTPVAEVIRRCTRREPAERFQTPQELVDALERVLDHPSLSAATGWLLMLRTAFYAARFTEEGRPRRAFPWVVGSATAAILAVTLVAALHHPPPPPAMLPGVQNAKLKADLNARLIALGDQRASAGAVLTKAQQRAAGFAAAASDASLPEASRSYAAERRARWDRYVAWLQDDPVMAEADTAIKTAQAVVRGNPQAAVAAVNAAEQALGGWQQRLEKRRGEIYSQPLFAWCLDRGRDHDFEPLRQAREDLADLPTLAADFVKAQRADLGSLDRPAAIPESTPGRVQLLAMVVGEHDADVERWTTKIAAAQRAKERCAVFHQAQELDPTDAQALRSWIALVGADGDQAIAEGDAKLALQTELRPRLATLDATDPPRGEALPSLVADLKRWEDAFGAGENAKRWGQRLELAQRWAPSREILQAVDQGRVDPATIGPALAVARAVKGERDADVLRWTAAIKKAQPWWPADWADRIGQDQRGWWADLTVDGATQRLRWIAGGATFAMGSPAKERGRDSDEEQHRVTITADYWLADSECTQAFWQAVMGDNPSSSLRDPRRPVVDVTWARCGELMTRLNQRLHGGRARLPTEAEWEYACRAGATAATGDAAKLDAVAWYSGDSGDEAQQVRQKAPNGWGLYDMLGNVDEWCADYHHPFASGALIDPTGPASGSERVYRGGSFASDPEFCRAARRGSLEPDKHRSHLGLRFAVVSAP
jgi:hypothetical protein